VGRRGLFYDCGFVQPKAATTHVFFKSYDGYSTNNPLRPASTTILIAHRWNGNPISAEHGGPARYYSQTLRLKGAKFIREITFLDRDLLGFWEVRGYSNTADPGQKIGSPKRRPPPGFP
jgi:DMSO/TMAO reductase YedYZ molybdopterin-dependent catalytic subunit